MSQFLVDLANSHKFKEGWKSGTIAFRQNNPGNIMFNQSLYTYYGATSGEKGFAIFPHYQVGFMALMDDLKAKITGTAGSVKNYETVHAKTYEQLTFQDYILIYAPPSENDSVKYCQDLCGMLSQYNLKPSTPLSQMAQLIEGTLTVIPTPSLVVKLPTPADVPNLERRLTNEKNPTIAAVIGRLIRRLLFLS